MKLQLVLMNTSEYSLVLVAVCDGSLVLVIHYYTHNTVRDVDWCV